MGMTGMPVLADTSSMAAKFFDALDGLVARLRFDHAFLFTLAVE